jgi:hypothetical protein
MFARAMSRAHVLAAAMLLVAVGSLIGPPARAQSLADIAKKEEDRRKGVAAPSKVYTNKDLNPVPAGSPPPAAPAPTGKPSEDPAKAADGDAKAGSKLAVVSGDKGVVKDQAYWAGRLKALQDALSRDENYADAMQTRINALTTDFVNRDDPAQRAVIEGNRQKSIAELARLTKSVQDTKKAIADLLEEARRAGVPPGWLR